MQAWLLHDLMSRTGLKITPRQARAFICTIDENGDGSISFSEFVSRYTQFLEDKETSRIAAELEAKKAHDEAIERARRPCAAAMRRSPLSMSIGNEASTVASGMGENIELVGNAPERS